MCVFSNTEKTKIRISKSKTGVVDFRIDISTIKCLGSGHIFRVSRGTGNAINLSSPYHVFGIYRGWDFSFTGG